VIYAVAKFLLQIIFAVGFRLEVHGAEKVPREGGLIIVSNHSSYLDPPLVGARLPRVMHTLAKAELFRVPLLGWFLRGCRAFAFPRGRVDRRAVRHCVDLLKTGNVVSLFPEGTRTPDGNAHRGKPGVAMIAVQANVPCLPCYIEGTFRAWPRKRWFPLPTKVRIYYGEPFDLPERQEGVSNKEYYQLCSDEMMRRIQTLRSQHTGAA